MSNPRLTLRANPIEAALDDAHDFRPVAMNTFVTEETFKGVGGKPSHKRVTMISVVEQEEQAPTDNTIADYPVDDDILNGQALIGADDDGEDESVVAQTTLSEGAKASANTMSVRPVLETPQPVPAGSWLSKISKALQASSAQRVKDPSPLDAATPSGNPSGDVRRPPQSIAGALFERALTWLSKQTGAGAPQSVVTAEAPAPDQEAARATADEEVWKDYVYHQVWAGLFNEPSVLHHIQSPKEESREAGLGAAHRAIGKWDEGVDVDDDEVLMDNVLLTPLPTRAARKRMFHGMPHDEMLPVRRDAAQTKQVQAPAVVRNRPQNLNLHFLGMPLQGYPAAHGAAESNAEVKEVPNRVATDEATSAMKGIDFDVPQWLGDRLRSLLPARPPPS